MDLVKAAGKPTTHRRTNSSLAAPARPPPSPPSAAMPRSTSSISSPPSSSSSSSSHSTPALTTPPPMRKPSADTESKQGLTPQHTQVRTTNIQYTSQQQKHQHQASNGTSTSASNSSRNPSQSPRVPSQPAQPSSSPSSTSSSSSSSSHSRSSSSSSSTSAAIARTYHKQSEPVYLNVYDLHPYNQYLHSLGFGAYHTAVQVFGREYSFGFHNSSETGVFSMPPRQVPNAVFRESIEAGHVYLTYAQFNVLLNGLKSEWAGNKYHLLKRNCNHFSRALLAALGLKAPSFINRLASAGDMLATVVPSFMLPKAVNTLIKNGRPDLLDEEEAEREATRAHQQQQQQRMLNNIPSGRSGQGGVPTLSTSYVVAESSRSGSRTSSGGRQNMNASPVEADAMDDITFRQFLRESEREWEREQKLRQLRDETRRAAEAAATATATYTKNPQQPPLAQAAALTMATHAKLDRKPDSSSPTPSTASLTTASPSSTLPLPPCPADVDFVQPTELCSEEEVEKAMKQFNLQDATEAEKQQIRAVLRMSIAASH